MAELAVCFFFDTFNFSSATKGYFSNVNILLTSLAIYLVKNLSLRFLIDGLDVQGGSHFHLFQHHT